MKLTTDNWLLTIGIAIALFLGATIAVRACTFTPEPLSVDDIEGIVLEGTDIPEK